MGPIGRGRAAVRKHVDVFEGLWVELVESASGLSGDNLVHVGKAREGMSPKLAKWFRTYSPRKAEPRAMARSACATLRRDAGRAQGQTGILAEEFHYKPASVAAIIPRRARNKHKLLTPTTKGRPGGSLTPKALAILSEPEE